MKKSITFYYFDLVQNYRVLVLLFCRYFKYVLSVRSLDYSLCNYDIYKTVLKKKNIIIKTKTLISHQTHFVIRSG